MAARPLTVAALTRRIVDALADLGPVQVVGELSQVKIAASGHCYATLKDRDAVVSLVMWRSTVARNGSIPTEGTEVLVRGSVEVYAPRGSYQIIARSIKPVGAGDLAAQFEELKARLAAEGLFDEDRKQALPFLPRGVGIATAAGSAALADLVHSLQARFPSMPLYHAPCLVQGQGAAASIVRALGQLDRDPRVELIIVGRGGGSLEDLWPFNEEAVVRAIAGCTTPVISAVGHETDTSLADFAADLRAKTPTAAGELAVPLEAELREQLGRYAVDLNLAMDRLLAEARDRLDHLAAHRALAGPEHQVAIRIQRLDELQERLSSRLVHLVDDGERQFAHLTRQLSLLSPRRLLRAQQDRLSQLAGRLTPLVQRGHRDADRRLAQLAGRLDSLSPLAVLSRGYGLVTDPDGQVITSAEKVAPADAIDIQLTDGRIRTTVSSADDHRPWVKK